MLKDLIGKYTDWLPEKEGETKIIEYNCAEAMLNVANDYYGLALDEKTLKAIAPLGGGFYMEKTCGLVTGGLAAIGVRFAPDERPYASEEVIAKTQKWLTAFAEEFGDLECKVIKEGRDCRELAAEAAALFESLFGGTA